MSKICAISGSALGHVGRLFNAALAIRKYSTAKIHFAISEKSPYAQQLLRNEFEYFPISHSTGDSLDISRTFAAGMEQHFRSHDYDLIIQDANPVRWTSLIKFPLCPRIVITNAFLTGIRPQQTVQKSFFESRGSELNRLRFDKGLGRLDSVYELYNADKVLLADPPPLVDFLGVKPAHYIACGDCSWTYDGCVPAELEFADHILLLSMGSTGLTSFDSHLLDQISTLSGARLRVYAGSRAREDSIRQSVDYAYEWLPITELAPKCTAVISQGGAGSSYHALSRGCPLFIAAKHKNHQILGEILEKMGLAFCISDSEEARDIQNFDFKALKERVTSFAKSMDASEVGADRIAKEVYSSL